MAKPRYKTDPSQFCYQQGWDAVVDGRTHNPHPVPDWGGGQILIADGV